MASDGVHRTQDEMTGEFNLLLWAAGVACFVSYGMLPQADNLYLGVVLFCVVTVTGVFSYLQNAKSDNMMNEFKSMRSVSPRFELVPSHDESCPSHDAGGGFFFKIGAVRTESSDHDAPRRPSSGI